MNSYRMKNQEIERKFLIKGAFKTAVSEIQHITQGFLSKVPERTVRIRLNDNKGFLTIKGISDASGISRYEFEKEISLADAKDLLALCEPGIIEKTRYIIPVSDTLFFEVDEFHGKNEGLVLAEIELPTRDTHFEKPNWLGKEVTGDVRYYNSTLAENPYENWKK